MTLIVALTIGPSPSHAAKPLSGWMGRASSGSEPPKMRRKPGQAAEAVKFGIIRLQLRLVKDPKIPESDVDSFSHVGGSEKMARNTPK